MQVAAHTAFVKQEGTYVEHGLMDASINISAVLHSSFSYTSCHGLADTGDDDAD